MKTLFFVLIFVAGIIGAGFAQPTTIHTCTEMIPEAIGKSTDLPTGATARAVSYKPSFGLYWQNGSTVRVRLIGGTSIVRQKVQQYANEWTRYANINFEFVSSGAADLRVSFVQNGSSWSVIGRQALQVADEEPTMNFGWLNDQTPEFEFRRTILHEFGHALGLLHEHQNPSGGIPWNEEAVYDHYRRTQGWPATVTYQNVIQRAARDATQFSAYDPKSIMHYPVPAELTIGQYSVGMNERLSATDIAYIRKLYPGRSTSHHEPGTGYEPENPTENPTASVRHQLTIHNELGNSQTSERVELMLGGKQFVFDLDENGQQSRTLKLRAAPGTYNYQVTATSNYLVYDKIWNGRDFVWQETVRTIHGSGSGQFEIKEDTNLAFYGRLNYQTGQMEVYLDNRYQNQQLTISTQRNRATAQRSISKACRH